MNFCGMTTDEVSGHLQLMSTDQQRLEELGTDLGSSLTRSQEFWRGEDAERFRAAFATALQRLADTATQVSARSTELAQHLQEQEQASRGDSDGGVSAPGSGGDGETAGDGPVDKTNHPGEDPYYGEVDPEVAERWRELSDEEREAVAREIIEQELARYGLEDVDIDFEAPPGYNGWWEVDADGNHSISIDGDALHNPRLLHTLAHEARHAAQWEATKDTEPGMWDWLPFVDSTKNDYERLYNEHGFTREEIDAWREHWDTPKDERGPYLDQPVELDARDRGAEFSDDLTMDDLEQYMEDAGVTEEN
ncbi:MULTISPECIES: WXG100 family type VII secretion target [unclassified Brachybacterium]|uniref:WXG100 family type VII secretion target n=1 Tax=unclassified Brachybacterium TaxID=2623841 RepID=UPI000C7FC240|nr:MULTISPECIES: HMG-box domain-containing protein [unclassified Brachybacterium]PMC76908.1 hypothetical protein CJ197_00940 [Brachybacterium sp. UMB0905]